MFPVHTVRHLTWKELMKFTNFLSIRVKGIYMNGLRSSRHKAVFYGSSETNPYNPVYQTEECVKWLCCLSKCLLGNESKSSFLFSM